VTTLAHTRLGAGAPLVLLHGIGSSRQAWDPVLHRLAAHFDVIAVDLPGFGESDPLPDDVEPTPAALAAAVTMFLDRLGVRNPSLAGNSLGGWVALEVAAVRPVAALALLSPAGLWKGRAPLYNRVSLRVTRWVAEHATGAVCRLMRYRLARLAVLGQTHGRPAGVTPEYARTAVRAMGTCSGFAATMRAAESRHFAAGPRVTAPVTVAFGSRDLLLLRGSRHLDLLPAGAVGRRLPGCGHVPMADDPVAVAAFVAAAVTGAPRG
jgi:pimeloyl-ACP methyl ester carboxylesterase